MQNGLSVRWNLLFTSGVLFPAEPDASGSLLRGGTDDVFQGYQGL